MKEADCIFCKIVAGEAPSHTIAEDDTHLAFLSIFPNTEGFAVAIPKEHHGSYFAEVDDAVAGNLMRFAKQVALKLDAAFPDVGRTGLVFEGFGVNHLHAKLVPMHGTNSDDWKQHKSAEVRYFEKYPGFISSHDSGRADDEKLAALAERIRAIAE